MTHYLNHIITLPLLKISTILVRSGLFMRNSSYTRTLLSFKVYSRICGTSKGWVGPSSMSSFEHISSYASSLPIQDCLWQFLEIFLTLFVKITWMEQEKCGHLFRSQTFSRSSTCDMCELPHVYVLGPIDSLLLL